MKKLEFSNYSKNIITKDELKQLTPAAFSKQADPKTSNRYKFVSTLTPLNALEKLNFKVVEARQMNNRNGSKSYDKHIITLINPDYIIKNLKDQVEELIQIHIINSHNGKSHLKLNISLLRLVCENGMLGIGNTFTNIDLKHMGFNSNELELKIEEVLNQIPSFEKLIKRMKGKIISNEIKKQLALTMSIQRFDEEKAKKVNLDKLLIPLRPEDKGNQLWTVFNLIQEKLIKGGEYSESNKKVRAYNNFELQIDLNKKLFEVAEQYI